MLSIMLSAGPTARALADTASDRDARNALFDELLRDPANVELNLRYAELSEKLGDTEAAISALERLVVYAPDRTDIRLQLGLLYLSIGSNDMARSYL
jgi:hypothetical protein